MLREERVSVKSSSESKDWGGEGEFERKIKSGERNWGQGGRNISRKTI